MAEAPITPEVPAGAGEAPTAEELKAQLAAEFAEKEKGLVAQIVTERNKRQEVEAQLLAAKQTEEKKPKGEEDDVEKKIRDFYETRRKEDIASAREKAFKLFFQEHPEFNPANDITGLKQAELQKALGRLNVSQSESVEDILKDYEDALALSTRGEVIPTTKVDMGAAASLPITTPSPKAKAENQLSPDEEKLRQELGWTVDKFLKIKTKYPHIVQR